MKPIPKICVVTMYRGGDREKHSYVLGAYTDQEKALRDAFAEEAYRGGKYVPEIIEFRPNADVNQENYKTILALPVQEAS